MDYKKFLNNKIKLPNFDSVKSFELPEKLFPFQKDLVEWALKKGRCGIYADTGLGKTAMQLSWAHNVQKYTSGNILILAPLCVSLQTINEGKKFGIDSWYVREQSSVKKGINITNYEMIHEFDFSEFTGIVLDESSILKHQQGKVRNKIIENSKNIPFRLSCTATPSPNDFMELGSQAEFLGVMSALEMLSMYFTHDGGETSKWRLKGHGKWKFWEWMASWAAVIKKPGDLGYNNNGYDLPELNIINHTVNVDSVDGCLFPEIAKGLLDRNRARKESINDRVNMCADLVNKLEERFIVWCHLNEESEKLHNRIEGSKQVLGSYSIEKKEKIINDFTYGNLKVLITKPSISGFGMNWQHINNMAFVGLSDSWEQYYQAVRRCYRFGQKKNVNVHIISAETEGNVVNNIRRKEKQNLELSGNMVKQVSEILKTEIKKTERKEVIYEEKKIEKENYTLYNGDCVEVCKKMEKDSIDYSIFSPPFSSLYTYSNSDRDMGNSLDDNEFYEHFKFLITELYRVIKPGRLVSFHCMNYPTMKQREGFIGLRDFRGELIRRFVDVGFIYHSEVCIWKDPVVAMQRTKALGLLWKQIKKDSSMCRMGIPDYVVTMRKPGDNTNLITHTPEEFPVDLWQKIASPVWMDINQSKTLNKTEARESDDERHICPLQLDVIERCLLLWSKENDVVFSPFAGIGSEGYQALKMGRKFIGIELKESYYNVAIKNLKNAKTKQISMF